MVTQSIPLVADLRTQNRNIGTIYLATGLVTEGDTGGGIYFWNPASTNADDGFYYLQVTGVATGRWVRIYAGSNIYNTDGSLLDNRDVTLSGNYLKFIGTSANSTFNADGTVTLGSLSGANTRMVVAGTTGTLSTQSFVPGTTIRFVEKFSAILGQTVFNTANTLYGDLFDVFLNGVKLNTDSFSFTANQIVLIDGSYAGDIIDVVGFSSITVYATLPSQAGNAGKFLSTDGTSLSWETVSASGFVPYTGATADVNLGEFELKAGQLTLDVSPTGTAAVGTTRWNNTIGSSETTLKGGSVILKNGVDLVARVVNKVSPNTTLTKAAYQAVRVSGAQGQRLAVALAQANNDANSADTIGLVCETIATNQEGFIMTVGQLENINTTGSLQGETWADGDVLYLSPFTPGAITKVKPTGNGHIVVIGYVEYAHANNGKIYVKVMNGWELDELHDVSIVSAANNEALIYESSTQLWKNKTIASALGYTPISGTGATGQVAYWNGTNSQAGSNNLFWDAANSRLGIGTNAPASLYKLDVVGAIRASTFLWSPAFYAPSDLFFGISGGTSALRITTNRNTQIFDGTTPADGGQRLQVYGDAFIKGSGATSATTAFLVQNSAGLPIFVALNNRTTYFSSSSGYDGTVEINTPANRLAKIGFFEFTAGSGANWTGTGIRVDGNNRCVTLGLSGANTTDNNALIVSMGGSAGQGYSLKTSGTIEGALFDNFTFAPTSGTATFSQFVLRGTINQTGGANGITRGLYVNPTLTAAADWRSIEWSNNSGWGLYGAGTSANFLEGSLGIGTTSLTGYTLRIGKSFTGATTVYGTSANGLVLSDVTSNVIMYESTCRLQSAAFTLSNFIDFRANGLGLTGGSAITNRYGFFAGAEMTTAANNYGFYGNIPNAANRWNLYMAGTADNYLRGKLLINTTSVGTFDLDVNGTARVSGAMTIGGNVTGGSVSSGINLNIYSSSYGNNGLFQSFGTDGLVKLQMGGIGTNECLFFSPAGVKQTFFTGGSSSMTLAANGNLGIGTSSPATKLVVSDSGAQGIHFVPNTASKSYIYTYNTSTSAWVDMVLQTLNTIFIVNGVTEGMRLTSSGRLLIGTTTENNSAILNVTSTTQGFLPPRMTTTQKNAIGTPAAGLIVFDTTLVKLCVYNGTAWETITSI